MASVAVAVSLIGTIGTAAELGADPLSGFATGAWRGVIGAAGLVVVSTLRGQAPWRYPLPVRWVAFGGLGVVFSQLLFFEAMARTGVAVGTLVAIGAAPLMAALIDWLAYRHNRTDAADRGIWRWPGWPCCRAGPPAWRGAAVALAVVAGCGIPCQGIRDTATGRGTARW